MASRFTLAAIILSTLLSPLWGQTGNAASAADTGETMGTPVFDTQAGEDYPFPISPLLETAASGRIPWRPDWPAAIPPDAFAVFAEEAPGGPVSALTLTLDAGEYRLRRGTAGGWAEFPVFLRGGFYQGQTLFDSPPSVSGITILTGEPWEAEILARADGRPSLVRIVHGEEVYFAVLRYRDGGASETWYDRDGNAAAVFLLEYPVSGTSEGLRRLRILREAGEETEAYDYDNRGNISALSSSRGQFSALYTEEHRPRYWERRTCLSPEGVPPSPEGVPSSAEGEASAEIRETYTLQWDTRGFLVRITGAVDAEPVDLRYEYTLDERGNWTTRREIRMLHRFGFLIPAPGTELKRTIEYGEP
jgi:hypothetical protein